MNCDQAFDLLTDLERRHAPALGEHLARCARCRGMAEALSPVLGLWDDAVGAQNGGGTQVASVRSAMAVQRLPEETAATTRWTQWSSARQWLAAFAAGVIVALGFHAIAGGPFGAATPVPEIPVARCTWLEREAENASSRRSAGAVIRSCIACHTPQSGGSLVTLPQL
jgi:hypothetical protein